MPRKKQLKLIENEGEIIEVIHPGKLNASSQVNKDTSEGTYLMEIAGGE